jgi:F-type H+-transporting ATPase subunit epsilon
VHYTKGGEKRMLTVFGGFAEVGPDMITLLARQSETPEMLDAEHVKTQLQTARKRMGEAKAPEEIELAQAALTAAEIRVQVLGL